MKERYVKPIVMVERFSLAQSIAVSCGAPVGNDFGPNSTSATTCTWTADSVDLFIAGITNGCWLGPESEDEDYVVDGYCYNNPDDMFAMFSSG